MRVKCKDQLPLSAGIEPVTQMGTPQDFETEAIKHHATIKARTNINGPTAPTIMFGDRSRITGTAIDRDLNPVMEPATTGESLILPYLQGCGAGSSRTSPPVLIPAPPLITTGLQLTLI